MTLKIKTEPLHIAKINVHKPKESFSVAEEFMKSFLNSPDIQTWTNTQKGIFYDILSRLDFKDNEWNKIKIPCQELIDTLNLIIPSGESANQVLAKEIKYMKNHCYMENLYNPFWKISVDGNLFERVLIRKNYIAVSINPNYRIFLEDEVGEDGGFYE